VFYTLSPQSNILILHFSSPCNEFTSVCSIFLCNTNDSGLIYHLGLSLFHRVFMSVMYKCYCVYKFCSCMCHCHTCIFYIYIHIVSFEWWLCKHIDIFVFIWPQRNGMLYCRCPVLVSVLIKSLSEISTQLYALFNFMQVY